MSAGNLQKVLIGMCDVAIATCKPPYQLFISYEAIQKVGKDEDIMGACMAVVAHLNKSGAIYSMCYPTTHKKYWLFGPRVCTGIRIEWH